MRRPDVCFIRADRLGDVPDDGFVPIRPDLTVDVYHPADGPYDIARKMADYRSAGVQLVWVVDPAARLVRVSHADGSTREFAGGDTLDGGDVLPGFAAVVRGPLRDPAA